ncbi:glycosyltransferase [Leadbettera azotonutricia]|uniref:glycosyltransferase n=1 Tax=Leadbettera azotonutricia TaxID=150829 RepID=UPI000A014F51
MLEKQSIRQELGYATDDFIITNVAEISRSKNQIMLIKNLPVLKNYIPTVKVLLIGNDNYKTVRKLVDNMGLQSMVEFLGYRKDIDKLLAISNVGFSASSREGCAINIVESMASGLPIVCSNIRGHRDIIINGKNGFLFELNEPQGMINSIIRLYEDKKLREIISINNIIDIQRFSIDEALEKMIDIYMHVM